MSLVTHTAQRYLGVVILALAMGCGGGNGDDAVDAGDADPCGFASDRYLPYEVGFTWEYQVTDLASGEVKTKTQTLDPGLWVLLEDLLLVDALFVAGTATKSALPHLTVSSNSLSPF